MRDFPEGTLEELQGRLIMPADEEPGKRELNVQFSGDGARIWDGTGVLATAEYLSHGFYLVPASAAQYLYGTWQEALEAGSGTTRDEWGNRV